MGRGGKNRQSRERKVRVRSPLQSSIYISGFLLTSDRTDTRTRACGTAKSFENLKITFYIVVGENRYTCRNGQKCVCTITHVRNAPGYAAVTFSSSRIGDIFPPLAPRFNRRSRKSSEFRRVESSISRRTRKDKSSSTSILLEEIQSSLSPPCLRHTMTQTRRNYTDFNRRS